MRNKKVSFVRRVQEDIHAAEAAQEVAIGRLGQLLATTCLGKGEVGLEAEVGREGISRLLKATALMDEAREVTLAAHANFTTDARGMLPIVATGDWNSAVIREAVVAEAGPRLVSANA